jgi:hypothetical protein
VRKNQFSGTTDENTRVVNARELLGLVGSSFLK